MIGNKATARFVGGPLDGEIRDVAVDETGRFPRCLHAYRHNIDPKADRNSPVPVELVCHIYADCTELGDSGLIYRHERVEVVDD